MVVTITASFTVTPNEETPSGCLWLSPSDQVVRHDHTPTIYIYKEKPKNKDVIEKMRDSLSEVLVHYYPVAGRLRWIEGGRLELDCNSKGVILLEAKSTKTLAEYGDFSPVDPIKELIPTIDKSQPKEEVPLFLAQVTRFRDDEGIAIGIAWSHVLGDGIGAIRFINAWAKVTRGGTLGIDEIPFLDRTILKFTNSPSEPRLDHPAFKPLPPKIGSSEYIAEKKREITFKQLKLTPKQVEKLKMNANSGNNQLQKQGTARPYSRFEAIAAHIWRCACKARELDEKQPSVVKFSCDFRSRLKPPLPENYFGNALATVLTPECLVGEIVWKPLGYAAQKIREAVESATDEYVRWKLEFIAQKKDISSMRPSHDATSVSFFVNPNLNITSWTGMPVYEADFGWGKPVHFGHAALSPFDRSTILQGPDGDGSVIVLMNMPVAHIEKFVKFFSEDICEGSGAFKEKVFKLSD